MKSKLGESDSVQAAMYRGWAGEIGEASSLALRVELAIADDTHPRAKWLKEEWNARLPAVYAEVTIPQGYQTSADLRKWAGFYTLTEAKRPRLEEVESKAGALARRFALDPYANAPSLGEAPEGESA